MLCANRKSRRRQKVLSQRLYFQRKTSYLRRNQISRQLLLLGFRETSLEHQGAKDHKGHVAHLEGEETGLGRSSPVETTEAQVAMTWVFHLHRIHTPQNSVVTPTPLRFLEVCGLKQTPEAVTSTKKGDDH